jgi:hypothetical protein
MYDPGEAPMKSKLEFNESEIEQFIKEVDSIRACGGRSCLEDAIKAYIEKVGLKPDEQTSYQFKSIYENHKALHKA